MILTSINSNAALAEEQIEQLPACIVVSHCVIKAIPVGDVEQSFNKAIAIVSSTPRTEIIELGDDYIHAEATTKWMRYIDDLEVKAVPKKSILLIRSESRVGIGDFGVNQKRIEGLEYSLTKESQSR